MDSELIMTLHLNTNGFLEVSPCNKGQTHFDLFFKQIITLDNFTNLYFKQEYGSAQYLTVLFYKKIYWIYLKD